MEERHRTVVARVAAGDSPAHGALENKVAIIEDLGVL